MPPEPGSFDLDLRFPTDRTESEVYASVVSTLRLNSDLPREVLSAVHDEYILHLHTQYPKALIPDADFGWQIDRQVAIFLDILKAFGPRPVPTCSLPRESYVVTLALMAKRIFHAAFIETDRTPPRPTVKLTLPDHCDLETLEQTVTVWYGTGHGHLSELRETIMRGVRMGLIEDWFPSASEQESRGLAGTIPDRIDTAIQEGSFAIDQLLTGASPQLVSEIVSTGEIPKESEPLLGVRTTKEKGAMVKSIVGLHEEMKRLHNMVSIPAYADWLESQAGGESLLVAMKGHWLAAMHELLPILPPEMATAQLLPGIPRWLDPATTSATRAFRRWESRVRRDRARSAFSYDDNRDANGEPIATHERDIDPSAEFADGRDGQSGGVLAGLGLTKRQQEVADLISQGYTQSEVAEKLGISPPRVSQIKDDIARKVTHQLEAGD